MNSTMSVVLNVQDHHLGGAAGLATGFDDAGKGS